MEWDRWAPGTGGRSSAQGESAGASARVAGRGQLARDSPVERAEVQGERSGVDEAAVHHRRIEKLESACALLLKQNESLRRQLVRYKDELAGTVADRARIEELEIDVGRLEREKMRLTSGGMKARRAQSQARSKPRSPAGLSPHRRKKTVKKDPSISGLSAFVESKSFRKGGPKMAFGRPVTSKRGAPRKARGQGDSRRPQSKRHSRSPTRKNSPRRTITNRDDHDHDHVQPTPEFTTLKDMSLSQLMNFDSCAQGPKEAGGDLDPALQHDESKTNNDLHETSSFSIEEPSEAAISAEEFRSEVLRQVLALGNAKDWQGKRCWKWSERLAILIGLDPSVPLVSNVATTNAVLFWWKKIRSMTAQEWIQHNGGTAVPAIARRQLQTAALQAKRHHQLHTGLREGRAGSDGSGGPGTTAVKENQTYDSVIDPATPSPQGQSALSSHPQKNSDFLGTATPYRKKGATPVSVKQFLWASRDRSARIQRLRSRGLHDTMADGLSSRPPDPDSLVSRARVKMKEAGKSLISPMAQSDAPSEALQPSDSRLTESAQPSPSHPLETKEPSIGQKDTLPTPPNDREPPSDRERSGFPFSIDEEIKVARASMGVPPSVEVEIVSRIEKPAVTVAQSEEMATQGQPNAPETPFVSQLDHNVELASGSDWMEIDAAEGAEKIRNSQGKRERDRNESGVDAEASMKQGKGNAARELRDPEEDLALQSEEPAARSDHDSPLEHGEGSAAQTGDNAVVAQEDSALLREIDMLEGLVRSAEEAASEKGNLLHYSKTLEQHIKKLEDLANE
eukprot:g549.t1